MTMPLSDRELAHDIKRTLQAVSDTHSDLRTFMKAKDVLHTAKSLTNVLDFADHPQATGHCEELDQAVRWVIGRYQKLPGSPRNDVFEAVLPMIGELKEILGALPANGHDGGRRQVEGAAWSARQLLQVATRLLPGCDRARYAEEFRSELWDLAGAGRWQQILYAARQLLRAGHLRIELKAPRRSKAPS
ncbi:hypothetical protein [Actinoallomurus sp. CA-142502]|uniref:hypothetical protein n=1 Tax=Actinoallomurus sp. CA-142502 TaxID=3239885 RepID=UPI003D8F22B7